MTNTTPSGTKKHRESTEPEKAPNGLVSVPDPRTGGGGSGEVAYINSLWDTASIQAS